MLRPQPDELANTVTHALGLLLSVVGAVVLVGYTWLQNDLWRSIGCGLYAGSLVGVYFASTLSHSASIPRQKRFFRILDQAFIYLLIAGTYTPFALMYLRSGWWWLLLAVMWTLALGGFISKILFAHRIDGISLWFYVLLGWIPIFAGIPLVELVPATALWWMLIGGLCYTIGTVFLFHDDKVPHFHAVWHLLVIAGSVWHYFAILVYVAQVKLP